MLIRRIGCVVVLEGLLAIGCNALLDNGDGRYVPAPSEDGGLDATTVDSSDAPCCVGPLECKTGYELVSSGEAKECVWRGGPRDPDFRGQPDAWQLGTQAPGTDRGFPYPIGEPVGTFIDGDASAAGERGVLVVTREGLCAQPGARSGAWQRIDMPSAEDSEAFSLRVRSRGGNSETVRIGLAVGGATYVRKPALSFEATSICLGEHAHGRDKRVWASAFIGANNNVTECNRSDAGAEAQLDSVGIEPDSRCPRVGSVMNGDFEGADVWQTGKYPAFEGTATTAAGIGVNDSHAAKLSSDKLCQAAEMNSFLSVPLGRPTALAFTMKGPAGRDFHIDLSRFSMGLAGIVRQLPLDGEFHTYRACLPEFAKGYVNEIKLSMPLDPPAGTTCSSTTDAPDPREYVIDNLAIEDAPDCPSHAYVLNGDFERQGAQPWDIHGHDNPIRTGEGGIVRGAEAHGGQGYAYARTSRKCGMAITQTITVPPPTGNGGPAVRFHYRTTGDANGVFRVDGRRLDPADTWTQFTHCLPLAASGSAYDLGWDVKAEQPGVDAGVPCDIEYPPQTLFLDDVIVTTDAEKCPVN